jgi:hypothetical protein
VQHFPCWELRLVGVPADLWHDLHSVAAEHCSPAGQRFPDGVRFPAEQLADYEPLASRRVRLVDGTALRLL